MGQVHGMATKIENIVISQNKKVPAHKLFYGVDAPYVKHLHTFSKVGIIHNAQKIHAKLENQAKGYFFVRYADDHGEGVYWMFNLKTCQVWTMRDMQWMNCNIIVLEQCRKSWETAKGIHLYDDNYDALHEWSTSGDNLATQDTSDNDDNDDDADGNDNGNDNEMESVETTESNRVIARVLCEMRHLSGWFNPIANKVIERAEANEVTKGTMAGANESSKTAML